MKDGRSHCPRVLKSNHITSEVSVTQCSTRSGNNEATVLDTVQKAVAQQEMQGADLTKTLADLACALSSTPMPQPRYQPKFTPDGQPICFKCQGGPYCKKVSTDSNESKVPNFGPLCSSGKLEPSIVLSQTTQATLAQRSGRNKILERAAPSSFSGIKSQQVVWGQMRQRSPQ